MIKKSFLATICFLGLFACGSDDDQVSGCSLEPDAGLCNAAFTRYYYDSDERECKEFIWGGCGGVVPFETMEDCEECIRN
jgi:hypothetical protein